METAEAETLDRAEAVNENAGTDVAQLNSKTLDLNKIDLTDIALAQFGDWRSDIASVTKQLTGVVHDLTTQAKIDEAKSLRFRLIGKPRATVRSVSKALKSKLASVSKKVGAEEDLAADAYDEAEKLITPQIESREAVLAAEKAERERIEAERVQALRDKIEIIRGFVAKCHGLTAERIANGIELVSKLDTSSGTFSELTGAALGAQIETLQAMRALHADAVERETEAARVDAQRVENERVAAEQKVQADALAAKQEAINKAAAELKTAQNKLAEEAAEQARIAKASAEKAEVVGIAAEAAQKALDCAIAALPAASPTAELVAQKPIIAIELEQPAELPIQTFDPAPTMNIGAISARLGFVMNSALLEALGFYATPVKNAKLYQESDFPLICDGLIAHIKTTKESASD